MNTGAFKYMWCAHRCLLHILPSLASCKLDFMVSSKKFPVDQMYSTNLIYQCKPAVSAVSPTRVRLEASQPTSQMAAYALLFWLAREHRNQPSADAAALRPTQPISGSRSACMYRSIQSIPTPQDLRARSHFADLAPLAEVATLLMSWEFEM